MNKRLLTLIASAGLLHSVSYAAGCVVGGTDFDTKADLCCPILTSDNEEGGWYNEDLDLNKICKSNMFAELGSSIQKGIGGVFQTNSIIDMTNVDDVFHLETMILRGEGQYGYSTITAQPKLIHPFCMANESANNMFVNIGSTDDCPFLSYTVQGLEPGTAVELSFTLHNLMDISYFEYLISNGKDTSDVITNYSYSKTGTITGNSLKVGVVSSDDNVAFNTAYNNALMLVSSKNVTTATTAYGSSTKVTHKATVPENGYITFYFYRSNECFQIPIGIDDISVVGSVQPTLKYTGNPCPQMPVRIFTKQNYPEGTKYTWKESKTGQVSTDANFNFIPKDGDTDYTVNCEVTIPGCSAAKAEPFTIHSGNCCTTSDSVPMAMTYLFYDDFGNFVSNDTYEWTDRFGVTHTEKIPVGQVHTSQSHDGDIKIPFVQAYNIENSGAILAVPMAGGTKTELYNHGVYVISKFGGYPGGVKYDNSGTETGGMLQFDLSDDGSQDEFFSIDIKHICTGKEVSFGADFASMSMHPGCIEVSLEYDGKTLASGYKSFTGDDGWQSVNEHFTLQPSELGNKSEATLTMKIRHNKDCVPDLGDFGTRDYAIDNIFFSVCTPPDVNLESSVTTGKNILDLCTEDVLTLSSVTTDAVKQFYLYTNKSIDKTKKLGYVYQYTFQDPSTENEINKITWKTIHKDEVIEDEYFDIEINEYWDDIFSKMTNDDRIYFRVVVGEYSDLIADQSWMKASAFSPCRNVSISSIQVVAGLNCTACTSPDPVKFSAEGGVFNAAKKTVVLEDGESTTLGMSNAVHGVDIDNNDYSDYDVKWFKEDITTTALASKKCQTGADDVAPSITVDYADVVAAGAKGVKYIISIHDNFDPTSSSSPCDITDTITVIANSKPVSNDNISYLFFDDFGNFTSDSTYEWKDILGETHKESIPAGQVHTSQSHGGDVRIPYVKAYNIEASGVTLVVPVAGADSKKTELYDHGVYVVSKYGGYPGGVQYDNSGTTTGGMLQFDLLDDGSQDEFIEIDLPLLTAEKEYTFGVDIAAISRFPSHIEIALEYDGKIIASADKTISGEDGWQSLSERFAISSSKSGNKNEISAKLKIRYIDDIIGECRDIAIDNIFVSTIVPPAVAIESSITGDSLLSLCTKPLTLTAEMSKSGKDAYKALNYLFQYTYSDPSSADAKDIVWKDLADVQEENTITISSPSKHESFAELVKDESLKIYFRVIAGEKEDLKNGLFSSASISEIPIVAGLDCTRSSCSQIDANSTVAITPNPASTKVSIVADGEVEKVEIINVVGEVVKVSDETEINVSDLSNGLYFVRTTIDGEITVHKLVISK